jgi:hypothetical protein
VCGSGDDASDDTTTIGLYTVNVVGNGTVTKDPTVWLQVEGGLTATPDPGTAIRRLGGDASGNANR